MSEAINFDATSASTEDLEGYDAMMIATIAAGTVRFANLAYVIWGEVLRELDLRGRVVLLEGSYDNIGKAKIARSARRETVDITGLN